MVLGVKGIYSALAQQYVLGSPRTDMGAAIGYI